MWRGTHKSTALKPTAFPVPTDEQKCWYASLPCLVSLALQIIQIIIYPFPLSHKQDKLSFNIDFLHFNLWKEEARNHGQTLILLQQAKSSLIVKQDSLCLPDPRLPRSSLNAHILSSLHQILVPVDKLVLVQPQCSPDRASSLSGCLISCPICHGPILLNYNTLLLTEHYQLEVNSHRNNREKQWEVQEQGKHKQTQKKRTEKWIWVWLMTDHKLSHWNTTFKLFN